MDERVLKISKFERWGIWARKWNARNWHFTGGTFIDSNS